MARRYTSVMFFALSLAVSGCLGGSGGGGGFVGGAPVATDGGSDGTGGLDAGGSSSGGADATSSSGGTSSSGSSSSGGTSSSGASSSGASSSGGTSSSGASSSGGSSSGADAGPTDTNSGPICGNGKCEAPETSQTCAKDCPASGPKCGDLSCAGLETANVCPVDCLPDAKSMLSCAAQQCGNEVKACQGKPACIQAVNNGLTCMMNCGAIDTTCSGKCVTAFNGDNVSAILASCAIQKGCVPQSTGPKCGDGKCEGSETSMTCPADCKSSGPVCGNGKCESGETKSSCAKDCGGGTTKVVGCGDETCASNESAKSCPIDCEQDAKKTWDCLEKNCSKEKGKCQESKSCLDALNDATVCVADCVAKGGSEQSCATNCQGKVLGNNDTLNLVLCGLGKCQ